MRYKFVWNPSNPEDEWKTYSFKQRCWALVAMLALLFIMGAWFGSVFF